MKIARLKKIEIKLTVLIVISLILLTACGTQPTTEPTPVSTVVLIQPASSLTPTNTPTAPLPSETPTPEARMTVEQQKAYLESHGIPVIINKKGEVVFDWVKTYTDPESMPIVHQETLADDLAVWAQIFHNGFPEPNTHDPANFSPMSWYTTVEEEKQFARFAVNVLSDEFQTKPATNQAKAVVFGMIDDQRYAFYFGRGLIIEPEEAAKNNGSYFAEYWVQTDGSHYLQASSDNTGYIQGIVSGKYNLFMDNITGTVDDIQSNPEPEWTSWQRANYYTWHLLHADLVGPDGKNILSVEDDVLLQRLVDWRGFSAGFQGKLFIGGNIPVTDIVPASVFVPTPIR